MTSPPGSLASSPLRSLTLSLGASPAAAQLDRLLQGLGTGVLSDAKIGAALKEALKVGTETTVNLTGKTDGYFANQAIKILMPEAAHGRDRPAHHRVRTSGGRAVLSMNRAAERAAPAARGHLRQHHRRDELRRRAQDLERGRHCRHSVLPRTRPRGRLSAAFKPVVERAMGETGVTRQYKEPSAASTRSRS